MDICVTCLSTGRTLTPLKSLYYLINEWRNLHIKLNGGICWECKAMLRRMCNFKKKVTKAQTYLNIVKYNPTLARPLSTLAIHHVSASHIYGDGQQMDENYDFKIEPAYEYEELTDDIYYEVDFGEEVKEEECVPVVKKEKRQSKIFKILTMTEEEMLKMREESKNKNSYQLGKFKCEDCLISYVDDKQYLRHRQRKHSEKGGRFVCPICQCHFSTATQMTKHKKSHYLLYQCQLCNQVENTKYRILHHYSIHRDGINDDKRLPNGSRNRNAGPRVPSGRLSLPLLAVGICEAIPNEWPVLLSLVPIGVEGIAGTQHLQSCNLCEKKFINKGALYNHMKTHNTWFECNECNKTFKEKKKLRNHIKFVHKECKEESYCVECDKHFKNNVIYKRHLLHSRKHTKDEELKHQCTECNKRFFDRTTFTRHLHKHFKIMEHKCHICVKSFIRKDQLDKHIRHIHEGVPRPKNKQCTICGRGFTRTSILINHIRTHTGDKPFQCTFCDSAFAQKTSLTSHIKAVHLKVPKKIKFEAF